MRHYFLLQKTPPCLGLGETLARPPIGSLYMTTAAILREKSEDCSLTVGGNYQAIDLLKMQMF